MKDIQKIKEFFSKPLEEDFGQALFNKLKPKDEDLKAIVDTLKQDSKIANAPDQASFKEALERYIRFNGDRGPIGQAAVRALGYRNTGDRYGNGFDRIFDMLKNKKELSLDEAKKETAIDMAKKQLDALGVKYEMSGNKFKPFKAIYKPINKPDRWYDEFDDIIHLFNLGSAVKQSMDESLTAGYPYRKTSGDGFEKIVIVEPMDDATRNKMIKNFRAEGWDAKPNNGGGITAVKKLTMNEANGFKSGKEFINIKLQKYPKAVAKINQLINMIGESNFTMEMAEWIWDFFNNASFESPINEATKKEYDALLDKEHELTVAYDKDRTEANWKKLEAIREKGKKLEKELKDKGLLEAKKEDAVDTITMDIPLFLRMLEYSREDAKQDLDLHDVTEKANSLGKEKGILSMEDYDAIVSAAEEIQEVNLKASKLSTAEYQKAKKLKDFKASDWKYDSKEDLYTKVNEGELTEAYVPSNIKDFAKRKGVSSLVNKVAGWAEKVGKGIRGGTAIGKNYDTLILDMGYQTADIYINTEDETIELYGEPVYSFPEFKQVYLNNQEESGSGLEERIAEALNKINEELCPAGKAYIKRRQAAGEKSSAYLSGRGVKVCKGQMSGKAKKK